MTKFNLNKNLLPYPSSSIFIAILNLCFFFILFDCALAKSSTDEVMTIANDRANRAIETSEKAFQKALDADKVAQEALSKSQIATELSNDRFATIRDLLYMLSVFMGIFLIITSLYEFNRRKIEQTRYDELMERQKKFDDIQIQLGHKSIDTFDESFKSQVDSVSKLGSIIALVEKTFENQSKASGEIIGLTNKVSILNDIIDKQKLFNITQFDKLYSDLLPFVNLSRMEWAWISPEEQIHIERALSRFEIIDEIILNEIKEREKVPHACYLLGVGAFYRNDIITALNYLNKAIEKYDELGGFSNLKNTKHHFPYAFANHFLGILEKNWWYDVVSLDVNKQKAKDYLEKAKTMLESKEGELLTPVTYAEVLTYIEAERGNAEQQLKICLNKLQKVVNKDKNQKSLTSRIFLYLGNIDYLNNNLDNAYKLYQQAKDSNEENLYAWFSKGSIAQELKTTDFNNDYEKGLELLNKSSSLSKPEITTHLTLLAWAVIASAGIHDKNEDDIKNQFKTSINRVRRIGSRIPLFFGPVSKQLVTHEKLLQEVESKIGLTIN